MIVDQEGLFALFGADGTPVGEVSTRAVQPVALAASIMGNAAVFAGRRGNVAVINLDDISLRWERAVSEANISVVSDLEIGAEGVYLFSRDGTIYGLNRKARRRTLHAYPRGLHPADLSQWRINLRHPGRQAHYRDGFHRRHEQESGARPNSDCPPGRRRRSDRRRDEEW